jgi:hypothetical protein
MSWQRADLMKLERKVSELMSVVRRITPKTIIAAKSQGKTIIACYSRYEVIELLRLAVENYRSQRAFALQHGIHPARVSHCLSGTEPPGPNILAVLGLKVAYVQETEAEEISEPSHTCPT